MNLLLLLSLLPLGRLSGGWMGNSGLYAPLIGVVFGLLLGVTDWWLLAFALAGWLSEKPSPAKYCMGLITDRYQHAPGRGHAAWEIKWLRDRPWIGVTVRGAISAAFFLPVAYFVPEAWGMLGFVIAWPLALLIGLKMPVARFASNAWEWSEIWRYFIVGLFLILH